MERQHLADMFGDIFVRRYPQFDVPTEKDPKHAAKISRPFVKRRYLNFVVSVRNKFRLLEDLTVTMKSAAHISFIRCTTRNRVVLR